MLDVRRSAGLVITGDGKFFSNGLNVEVIMSLKRRHGSIWQQYGPDHGALAAGSDPDRGGP